MLHRRCLAGCGHDASATRDIETFFLYRLDPLHVTGAYVPSGQAASLLPSGGGGSPSISKLGTSVRSLMDSETLLPMQKFIDQEEEREEQKAEVDAKEKNLAKTIPRL